MSDPTKLTKEEKREMRKALMALRLEVDSSIVDDIEARFNAVLAHRAASRSVSGETPRTLRPTERDFHLANELRSVALWIIERHAADGCKEPLGVIERVTAHLHGANIEAKHDLDWLLRNDPLIASLYAKLRAELASRPAAATPAPSEP